MPLLIRALDLPDVELRLNVLETLLAAARDNAVESEVISERATTLVDAMLKVIPAGSSAHQVSSSHYHLSLLMSLPARTTCCSPISGNTASRRTLRGVASAEGARDSRAWEVS